MYSLYSVPIDGGTPIMNQRLARFVAVAMQKPWFTSACVERYGRAVVCQEDGRIIGCAMMRSLPCTVEGREAETNIECVCVREESRGCGVGTDVLQYALEAAGGGQPVLWVDRDARSDDLLRFYEANGFEVVLERAGDFKMRLRS